MTRIVPHRAEQTAAELEQAHARVAELEGQLDEARLEIERLRERLVSRAAAPPAGSDEAVPPARCAAEPPQPFAGLAVGQFPTLEHLVLSREEAPASSGSPTSERRREARLPCELPVEFAHESHFYAGLSQDLSCGGLFVVTYHQLPLGTPLQLSFQLPDGSLVCVRGEVRWIREARSEDDRPGVGIAFTDVTDEALEKISALCRFRPPLYFDV